MPTSYGYFSGGRFVPALNLETAKQYLSQPLRFGDDMQIRPNRFIVKAMEIADAIRSDGPDWLEWAVLGDEELWAARKVILDQQMGNNPLAGLPGVAAD